MRLGRKWDIMGFHGPSTRFTVIGWIIKENCLGSHESDESRRESGKSLRNYPSVNQFSSILTGSFSFCSIVGDADPGAGRVVPAWDFMGRLCGGGGARRSVSRVLSSTRGPMDGHSSGTSVTGRLARPTRTAGGNSRRGRRVSPAPRPSLFGLAPGGVYPAATVAGRAVRSYRTLSPLPAGRFRRRGRFAFCGTVPGVAPAGRYPAPCSRGARTFLP